jgi:hypothetical protein
MISVMVLVPFVASRPVDRNQPGVFLTGDFSPPVFGR